MKTEELFILNYDDYKVLSQEEFTELFIDFKNGDEIAYEKLFMHNLKLVSYEINTKFSFVKYEKKELVSIGIVGLIKALNKYDLKKEIKFSTYAVRCIDNEILLFIRRFKHNSIINSLNEAVAIDKDGTELTILDTLESDENVEDDYIIKDEHERLRKIIEQLPPREREIIKMYFGFDGYKKHLQPEIANYFNITQTYVSKLIKKTLVILKEELNNTENNFVKTKNRKNK